jgi:smad nuclear-interacting protein 1
MSRPIKHEVNSEGKKSDHPKVEKIQPGQKEKPNFGFSGKLAVTNLFDDVFIKYIQPADAHIPNRRRLYPFKGTTKCFPTLYVHARSAYLIGKDQRVADIRVDHPSCSRQHEVLQYRLVPAKSEDGTSGVTVKPYIINLESSNGVTVKPYIFDLESANGTFLNKTKIDTRTFVELREKDVINFGYSSRDYVFIDRQSIG